MVTTNSLNTDFDRSLLEDDDAVIHIIEKRNQREVEMVLLDDHARQITANWLLHPGFTLGYDETIPAIIVKTRAD